MAARPLILPVETQVREFDAKLLLACVAAERGIPTYIGFQNRIRSKITSFPPGIVIVKGFAARKAKMLNIMHRLGHLIYGWDEEGLVHHPYEVYHDRRMGTGSLERLSGIFAWGKDYKEMVEACPFFDGTPVYETGNPRIDLLRSDVRSFYNPVVEDIRRRFGKYLLVNSSFGISNTAVTVTSGRRLGTAKDVAASSEYWIGQMEFRGRLFVHFMEMVDKLAARFPDRTVLLRPHPAEKIETWNAIAQKHENLRIVAEGNVVPWMMGADLIIHNGCMTAVEGTLLGKAALAYQPLISAEYDRHLPNSVSRQCFSLDELYDAVTEYTATEPNPIAAAIPPMLYDFIKHDDKKLSADLVMDVLEEVVNTRPATSGSPTSYATGWAAAHTRAFGKWARSLRKDDIYSPWHQRLQFPKLETIQVQDMIARLQESLGRFEGVVAREITEDVFLIDR